MLSLTLSTAEIVCIFLLSKFSNIYTFAFSPSSWETSKTKFVQLSRSSTLRWNQLNVIATPDAETTATPTLGQQQQPKSGLSIEQEDELDEILKEALDRMIFIMENNVLSYSHNEELRNLFQTCLESVEIKNSTITSAGRGLFAKTDITKGTIVAFYPIHAIGCKFPSGVCQSVQAAEDPNHMIDHENSSYAVFSVLDRPLCWVDIEQHYNNAKMFIDMNPKNMIHEGFYCGLINDGAVVRCVNDEEYYPKSRAAQNVEIIPFSDVAPFHVGVTVEDVRAGEELFVSYGYKYWINNKSIFPEGSLPTLEMPDSIRRQEEEISIDLTNTILDTNRKYREASESLEGFFDSLGSLGVEPTDVGTGEGEDIDTAGKRMAGKGSFISTVGRLIMAIFKLPRRGIRTIRCMTRL